MPSKVKSVLTKECFFVIDSKLPGKGLVKGSAKRRKKAERNTWLDFAEATATKNRKIGKHELFYELFGD